MAAASAAALLCVDMQNDFLLPESTLCVAGGLACLPKVKESVAAARAEVRACPLAQGVHTGHHCFFSKIQTHATAN